MIGWKPVTGTKQVLYCQAMSTMIHVFVARQNVTEQQNQGNTGGHNQKGEDKVLTQRSKSKQRPVLTENKRISIGRTGNIEIG
jgi:hypothetical protein